MIIHARLRNFLMLTGMLTSFACVCYLLPPIAIEVLYALASAATFICLLCMLQSTMTDSSVWFRLAMAGLAASCLSSSFAPFTTSWQVGPWPLVKALSLFFVVFLIRLRQVRRKSFGSLGNFFPE